ncbi:MAG TPA: CHRD domain-containing protein [Kofleriaceae bacterium]|nr:CHRD domain-containing protein [Kofleriaceae bacterium]
MGQLGRMVVVALAGLGAACDPDNLDLDNDDDVTFDVTLTPAQVVPVCPAAGADAAGSGDFTVSEDDTSITITNFTFSGLSGPVTVGHIHFGVAGMVGPVVLAFVPVAVPFDLTFTAADYPIAPSGAPADFAALGLAARTGQTYVDLHTEACPDGEIRGQIEGPAVRDDRAPRRAVSAAR